jgi:hypothetical protein
MPLRMVRKTLRFILLFIVRWGGDKSERGTWEGRRFPGRPCGEEAWEAEKPKRAGGSGPD